VNSPADEPDKYLVALLASMGEWLGAIVAQLARTSEWSHASDVRKSELLRETVIGLMGRAPTGLGTGNADEHILAAYFQNGGGTWSGLLRALRAAYPPDRP
jgi:hypothetical protein